MTDQVVKYSATEAGLNALVEKFGNPVMPDDDESYVLMKNNIKEVAKVRITIDKERKAQNASALAHQREVNRIGNGIIEQIKAIEDPMKAMIKEIDDAEDKRIADLEEAEAARLAKISERLNRIEQMGVVSISDTLEKVESRLKLFDDLDPNEGFDEFAGKAGELRSAGIKALTEAIGILTTRAEEQKLLDDARERAAEHAEKQEKELAEKEEKDRIEREDEQKRLAELEEEDRKRKAKEAEEAEAARKAATAPDRDKLIMLVNTLTTISFPTLDNDPKNTISRVQACIADICRDILADAENL